MSATQAEPRYREYIYRVEYPPEVLDLLEEHEAVWNEMVEEDIKKIVAERGHPGAEGLGFLHHKTHTFPPQDLVIAFIQRVKPQFLDELVEKGVVKRLGEDVTEST